MTLSRRGFLAASATAAALTTVHAASASAATTSQYQVSTGSVDITPAAGYPMAGYGTDTPRLSQGTNEPLRARCTVLWDSGTPNVIVTADVLAFGAALHQVIRSKVIQLGVASADFVLTATHTHNGPVLPEKLDPYISYNLTNTAQIQQYADQLAQTLADLVATTLASTRSTVTLDYQVVDEDFSRNRAGLSYVERDVPVLVARGTDGKPRAVLFSYGAHPVAAGSQTLFDPDYPAEAIKEIEAFGPGVFAQFILGPAGDQNPHTTGSVAVSDSFGSDLGTTVRDAIGQPGRTITGGIASQYERVTLPLDITVTSANLAAVKAAYDRHAAAPGTIGYARRHAQRMSAAATNRSFATTVDLPLQVWKFTGTSGLKMVFTGGEIVSGYAVYFRARNGGSNNLWFSGYANEVPAYIPSNELLARDSYEAGIDSDSPGIAGGSMSVYNHFGHFLRKTSSTAPDGVEEKMVAAITRMLA